MKTIVKKLVSLLPQILLSLLLINSAFPQQAGAASVGTASFNYTGTMTTNRENHTATLLPNGTVLVAGGITNADTGGVDLSTTELYDPGSGTWTVTGQLAVARNSHTATLLSNGAVLAAGGAGTNGILSSVEIYNPSTGKWTTARPMNNARAAHTATLLPNGKVLVAGGTLNAINDLASSELYDPSTGLWTPTGSLNIARAFHTATLLANGKVLVVGGALFVNQRPGTTIPGAELYDPATGKWTLTGAPKTARAQATTTLLANGKVLLVAGEIGIDGSGNSIETNSAELYDPAIGAWFPTGPLATGPRHSQAATLLSNGTVLITGGDSETEGVLAGAETYDPAAGVWTPAGFLNTGREWHTSTLLQNGMVLISGGSGNGDGSPAVASAELYSSTILPLQISTTSLPKGTNGLHYSQTLAASGGGWPYGWSLVSGALPPGLTLGTGGILAGTPTNNGTFNFTVQAKDSLFATATQTLALQIISVDTNPPVLTLTSPASGERWSNSVFTVSGAAHDNIAVSNVLVALNGSAWTNAVTTNHWTNWTAVVTLAPGTNTVQAYAVDTSGNVSTVASNKVDYILSALLTVRTNQPGWGGISPNENGAMLPIGGVFSLTATPAAGFDFGNWSEAPGIVLTNGRTLTFTMVSNLSLTASFVDTQRPALTITSPTVNQLVTTNSFTIAGTASDNAAVASVQYQLNGGGWLTAIGTNNWRATVTLTPGTNFLQAFAVDTSGNVSPTNTVRFVYVDKTTLIATISGKGALSPNYNGSALQIGENYTMTVIPAAGFVFSNWSNVQLFYLPPPPGSQGGTVAVLTNATYLTNSPTVTFDMAPGLDLEAVLGDVAPPSVTITSPVANQSVTTNYFVLRGTASDNAAVASVWYQVNGTGWLTASGANSWSAPAYLNPGTNVVQVYAVDTSGNLSPTNTVRFIYVDNSRITVSLNGQGTVSPNYNGQLLQVGQTYTMTAAPAAGFAFTDWTEILSVVGVAQPAVGSDLAFVLTNSPTVRFAMTPGLDLVANFADIAPPTLTITAPRSGQDLSNSVCYVLGMAKDNVAVAGVYCQINNGGWSEASPGNGWTNWSAELPIVSGTNTLRAYAVDTTGNVSPTNTVVFVNLLTGLAPGSLNGLAATLTTESGSVLTLGFGTNTFSLHPEDTNNVPGAGTYSYSVSNSTAKIAFTETEPPQNAGSVTLDLTFTSPGAGTYYNENSGDSGTISFAPAASLVPRSLNGTKALFFNSGGFSTLAFQNGTLILTNLSGNAQTSPYTFLAYSPVGAVLAAGNPTKGTNYVVMSYLATNNGDFCRSSFDNAGNFKDSVTGTFVFPSVSPVAPASPVGLAGRQVSDDGSVTTTAFGINGFSQQSTDAGGNFEVGAYGYHKLNATNVTVTLTAVAPPTATNNTGAAFLTFVAPNFFYLTNQDGNGSNEISGLSLSPVTTEVSLSVAGLTVYATNGNGSVDIINCHTNGTFTQVESNSQNPGASSGTYTYTVYGPIGAMLQMTYTNSSTPYSMVGDIGYVQVTYKQINTGTYYNTFYDNSGDPAFVNTGTFSLH